MRIRKGHRCLPPPPADRSSLHGVLDDAKDGVNQALLSLVALASASVADNSTGGLQYVQEHARDTSTERRNCLELQPERNRGSAGDDSNYRSPSCNAGVESAATESIKTPPDAKAFTKFELLDTTGTISSSTSATEIQHQPALLEQSLCHVCSRVGKTGLSSRDAVSQIIDEGLPGLDGVGVEVVEEVAKLFQRSDKFLESKEGGTFYLRDLPAGKEKKLPKTRDSEFHREEMLSSTDMLGAARQLQYLQMSLSNSLGSGIIERNETPSVHRGKRKVVQNKRFIRQSDLAVVHKDATGKSHISNSSASRRLNHPQQEPSATLCARDDGKRWKCPRPAQTGFAMCKYHRDLINQGKKRRMRARLEARPNSRFRCVANAREWKNAIMSKTSWKPFSDDELSYDEHRQFVKAKSITSLLLNSDVRPQH